MPTYLFREKDGREYTEFMTISERNAFLEANPDTIQLVNGAPLIGDPHRLGISKPPQDFRNIVDRIKRNNHGSTIQT
jgi:hypothetical protein